MDLLSALDEVPIIADGAMGTALFAAGARRDECLEALCLTAPGMVRAVHAGYLAAGARMICTNSLGSNAVRLARHGYGKQVSEINWTAAQLAVESAKATGAYVAGVVGPLGLEENAAKAAGLNREGAFGDQIGALLDGGVRIILLASFTDLAELRLAITAKHTLHHCPVIACVVVNEAGELRDGSRLKDAFTSLRDAGADVIGVNCISISTPILQALAAACEIGPVAAFPSAGIPEEGTFKYPVNPESFADMGLRLIAGGARLVGGCCGAGPEHIAALAGALDADASGDLPS